MNDDFSHIPENMRGYTKAEVEYINNSISKNPKNLKHCLIFSLVLVWIICFIAFGFAAADNPQSIASSILGITICMMSAVLSCFIGYKIIKNLDVVLALGGGFFLIILFICTFPFSLIFLLVMKHFNNQSEIISELKKRN